MAAGSIVIDLLLKSGSFETDTKRAEKRLKEFKKEVQQVGTAVGAAFGAVAIAAAYMAKSTIDSMDEMGKAAQRTGTTVEAFSALAYAADLSGISQEELSSALVKLSKNMSDAAMGTGEAIKGFEALGISVKDSNGSLKDSDKVLAEIANKFAGYKDGAEKTALAVNLFGRAGAQLIPLLNGGSEGLAKLREEAEKLGIVLDTKTSKAAEEFNDNLTRLSAAATGVKYEIVRALLPALIALSEELLIGLKHTNGFIDAILTLGTINPFRSTTSNLKVLREELQGLEADRARYVNAGSDTRGIDQAIANTAKQLNYLKEIQARDFTSGLGDTSDALSRRLAPRQSAPGLKDTKKPGSGKDADSDFKTYLSNLEKQIQKTSELSTVEKLLDDIRRKSLTVTPAQQNRLMLLAQEIDATKEAIRVSDERAAQRKKDYEDSANAIREIEEADRSRLKALTDSGPAAQLEKQRKEMLFLAEAFEKGRISAEEFNDAATGFLNLGAVKEQLTEMEQFTKRAAENIQDQLGEGLYNIMQGNFKNIGASFKQMLDRMVAEAIAADLAKRLFGGAVSGGSGSGPRRRGVKR